MNDGIGKHKNVWDLIRKFFPKHTKQSSILKPNINGKEGSELANHMAEFFI